MGDAIVAGSPLSLPPRSALKEKHLHPPTAGWIRSRKEMTILGKERKWERRERDRERRKIKHKIKGRTIILQRNLKVYKYAKKWKDKMKTFSRLGTLEPFYLGITIGLVSKCSYVGQPASWLASTRRDLLRGRVRGISRPITYLKSDQLFSYNRSS